VHSLEDCQLGQQVLNNFEVYVSKDLFDIMKNKKLGTRGKLSHVAQFIVSMGCPHPQESSIRNILTVALLVIDGKEGILNINPIARLAIVKDFKSILKCFQKQSPATQLHLCSTINGSSVL
jgi:hypothetical protein